MSELKEIYKGRIITKLRLALSVCLKKSFELIKLDLSWTILIDLFYKLLNVDCHLKLLFDGPDQLRRVYTSFAIGLTTHGHERLKHFSFIGAAQSLHLLLDHYISKCVSLY